MIGKINSLSRPPLSDALFGDGSDGALTVAKNKTTTLDVVEDTGQIIKQYTSLTIEEGATLKPAHRCNGTIILVNGDCTINGTLSVDKCSPLENDAESDCYNNVNIIVCGFLEGGVGGTGGDGYQSPMGKKYNSETEKIELFDGEICGTGGTGTEGHVFGGGYGGGGAGSIFETTYPDYTDSGKKDSQGFPIFNEVTMAHGNGNPNGGSYSTRPYKGMTWPNTTSSEYGAGGQGQDHYTKKVEGTVETYPGSNVFNEGIVNKYSISMSSEGGASPGGSGGSFYTTESLKGTAGDAYGGGALWLFVKGTLTIGAKGKITANGGKGGVIAPTDGQYIENMSGYPGSGGSGGGGIIALVYGTDYVNNGTVEAKGGGSMFFDSSKYQYGYNNRYDKYYMDSSGEIKSTKCQFIEIAPRTTGGAGSIGTVFVKKFTDL